MNHSSFSKTLLTIELFPLNTNLKKSEFKLLFKMKIISTIYIKSCICKLLNFFSPINTILLWCATLSHSVSLNHPVVLKTV